MRESEDRRPRPVGDEGAGRREIARTDLIEIVGRALGIAKPAASTAEKVASVAETSDAVAVGWFHCDGVTCPARQAGRRHQRFQTEFDMAMAAHFGIDINLFAQQLFEPFVAVVKCRSDPSSSGPSPSAPVSVSDGSGSDV